VDNRTISVQQMWGLKEDRSDYDTSTYALADDIVNSSDIVLEKDEDEFLVWDEEVGSNLQIDSTPLANFKELSDFMDTKKGWYHDLRSHQVSGDPAERIFNGSLVLRSTVIFTSYLPNADLCALEGDGFLYAMNFRTGTAEAYGVLGLDDDVVRDSVTTGKGANSEVIVINSTGREPKPGTPLTDDPGSGDSDTVNVILGTSTGAAPNLDLYFPAVGNGRMTWEVLDIPF
jgi:Tfp pilus tip-associated adhesin PilY1